MSERKPYEKPAVAFEKHLEALAANCDPGGDGDDNIYLGGVNCKAAGHCVVQFS